jgi:hypothetical protein
MEALDHQTGPDFFEVILYSDKNSWLFSTYADTFQVEAALKQAEDEFFIHSALHDIGSVKASAAYVLTSYGRHFYAKRNGKWQPDAPSSSLVPADAQKIVQFRAGDMNAGSEGAAAPH